MSGHSKWSTIKRKKGAQDAARGKIFGRIVREIIIAAREGGGDPSANPRLRTAIIKAKSENMPGDNIDRAIKRGTGEVEGMRYEEVLYEGYAKGGVAVLVECMTDNKNRTTPEVRHAFSKYGGSMGESGCVAYLFARRGVLVYDAAVYGEEALFEAALESGAEDVQSADGVLEVLTDPDAFSEVASLLEQKNYKPMQADIMRIPATYIEQDAETSEKIIALIEKLEELDDVQAVWHNLAAPESER